ncbi:IclR family transcriptional regulator domain-containing protein [Aquipuribacter sp. SD81]|uniref:IclR family transcriptional regulator domain-containing protein n=1 Tax=Aquipuribacter sp. SD81 TaxID=3127703 RepID=UPI0030175F11
MPRRDDDPDFVEAVARGLDVLRAFAPRQPAMSLSEVAAASGLARPTARRILLTLETLGYVRSGDGQFSLTPRVLELGLTYVQSMGLWDVARPHLEALVARTGESSSVAQLDGSDIVYVARVAVPKIIALAVQVGTRFPAPATSMGTVLLADLTPREVDTALAQPSRSGVVPRWEPTRAELEEALADARAAGYAVADEKLAPGVRSVAAPLRRGAGGPVVAAVNVTVHAAETSLATLLEHHLPLLLATAETVSEELALVARLPVSHVDTDANGSEGRPTGPAPPA